MIFLFFYRTIMNTVESQTKTSLDVIFSRPKIITSDKELTSELWGFWMKNLNNLNNKPININALLNLFLPNVPLIEIFQM